MAYGKVRGIAKPLGDIPARIYPVETNASESRAAILTVPFDFVAGDQLDNKLAEKLTDDFNGYASTDTLSSASNSANKSLQRNQRRTHISSRGYHGRRIVQSLLSILRSRHWISPQSIAAPKLAYLGVTGNRHTINIISTPCHQNRNVEGSNPFPVIFGFYQPSKSIGLICLCLLHQAKLSRSLLAFMQWRVPGPIFNTGIRSRSYRSPIILFLWACLWI